MTSVEVEISGRRFGSESVDTLVRFIDRKGPVAVFGAVQPEGVELAREVGVEDLELAIAVEVGDRRRRLGRLDNVVVLGQRRSDAGGNRGPVAARPAPTRTVVAEHVDTGEERRFRAFIFKNLHSGYEAGRKIMTTRLRGDFFPYQVMRCKDASLALNVAFRMNRWCKYQIPFSRKNHDFHISHIDKVPFSHPKTGPEAQS